MSSSSAPPPAPQGAGSVSDVVNSPARRDVIVADQHDAGVPDDAVTGRDTGTQAEELVALEGKLGELHGCDGLTTGSGPGAVCK